MLITHKKLVRALMVGGCRGEKKERKQKGRLSAPRGGGDTVDVLNSSFNGGNFSD